jgi:hypothetical protein
MSLGSPSPESPGSGSMDRAEIARRVTELAEGVGEADRQYVVSELIAAGFAVRHADKVSWDRLTREQVLIGVLTTYRCGCGWSVSTTEEDRSLADARLTFSSKEHRGRCTAEGAVEQEWFATCQMCGWERKLLRNEERARETAIEHGDSSEHRYRSRDHLRQAVRLRYGAKR